MIVIGSGLIGVSASDLLIASGLGMVDAIVWNDIELLDLYPKSARAVNNLHELRALLDTIASGGDLIITATMNAPQKCLRVLNDIALTHEIPILFGNDDGAAIDVGPLVHPYRSACLTCKNLREQSSDEHAIETVLYRLHQDDYDEPAPPRGEWVAGAAIGASLLVGEAIRLLTRFAPPTLMNAVLRLDAVNGTWNSNQCARVPRCPDCSRNRPT